MKTPEPEVHVAPPASAAPPAPPAPPAPMCVVPKMRALSMTEVKSALAVANCAPGSIAHHYSSLAKGTLTEQDRHERTVLPFGSKVNIWLSRGRHHRRHHGANKSKTH